MTIKQKIRKARVVYIFVRTSKGDGSHIKVSKSEVIKSLMGDEENDFNYKETPHIYLKMTGRN